MTAFGWNDSGGGTTVPRLAAKELARRGWEVTVFHAAVEPTESGSPYEVRRVGGGRRPPDRRPQPAHGAVRPRQPRSRDRRPADHGRVRAALDRVQPDVVHFHNLHNLGASLIDQAAARGLPAYFTTHNYWLICPRAYLLNDNGRDLRRARATAARCAACVGSADVAAHQRRLAEIRSRAERGLTAILAVSDAVRRTLLNAGYPADLVDTVRQAMPHDARDLGAGRPRPRSPGRVGERPDRRLPGLRLSRTRARSC